MSDEYSANPPCPPNTPSGLASMTHTEAMTKASQGLIEVKLPTGLLCPVSLHHIVIASPGERKTSISSLLNKTFQERNGKDGNV